MRDKIIGGIAQIWQKDFVKHLAVLSGAGVLSRIILLASYPVLTRLYDPSSFGLLATFTSIVAFPAILATLRYELAIPLPKNEDDANIILYLCTTFTLGWTLILLTVAALINDEMVGKLGFGQSQYVKWLIPLAVLGSGLYMAFTYWSVRRKKFKAIATTQISKIGGEVGLQLILGYFSFGAIGLILGNFVGLCLGVGTLIRAGRPYLKWLGIPLLWKRTKEMAIRYRYLPLFDGAATLMNEGGSRLFLLGIGIYYSQADLGLFWLALMLLSAISGVFINAAQRVHYAHASEMQRSSSAGLYAYYLKAVLTTAIAASFISVTVYFIVPPVFNLMFPENWTASLPLLLALIPAHLFKAAILPYLSYNIIEKQHIALVWNSIHMTLHLATIPVALYFGSDLFTLAATYSAALCLSYFSLFIIHLVILPKNTEEYSA